MVTKGKSVFNSEYWACLALCAGWEVEQDLNSYRKRYADNPHDTYTKRKIDELEDYMEMRRQRGLSDRDPLIELGYKKKTAPDIPDIDE